MKFLIVFALCVAAATARFEIPDLVAAELAEIQQIKDMINHPNTDPATAAALQQLLDEVLGAGKPEDSYEPIAVGPVIVENEEDQYEPISVGPAIVENEEDQYQPISVGPAIIPNPVPSPVVPSPASSPLVQIIINVNPDSENSVNVDASPAIVAEEPEFVPSPVIVVEHPEVDPTPVIVVEQPEVDPEPVIVVEEPEVPEPIITAPVVFPENGMVLPDILN